MGLGATLEYLSRLLGGSQDHGYDHSSCYQEEEEKAAADGGAQGQHGLRGPLPDSPAFEMDWPAAGVGLAAMSLSMLYIPGLVGMPSLAVGGGRWSRFEH